MYLCMCNMSSLYPVTQEGYVIFILCHPRQPVASFNFKQLCLKFWCMKCKFLPVLRQTVIKNKPRFRFYFKNSLKQFLLS
jgi:tRNA splicing ligase